MGGELPAGVLTVTATVLVVVPALSVTAGGIAVTVPSVFTVKDVALALPKVTAVAPARPVPVIVTCWPPAGSPPGGSMPVTTGTPAGAYV